MNFNFIDDPEWAGLDNETKTKVLGAAFQRDIASDKEWGGLPSETKQSVWDTYHKQAGEFEQSLQPEAEEPGFFEGLASDIIGGGVSAVEQWGRAGRALPYGQEAGVGREGVSGRVISGVEKLEEAVPFLKEKQYESGVKKAIHGGIRSATTSLTSRAPFVAAGAAIGSLFPGPGTFLGALGGYVFGGATLFGAAEYDRAREEGLNSEQYKIGEITKDQVEKYAMEAGVYESGGEFVSDVLIAWMLGGGALIGNPAKQPIKIWVKNLFKSSAKETIKRGSAIVAGETGGELLTAGLQTEAAHRIKLTDRRFLDGVKEAFGPAFVASLIFAGLGEGGIRITNSKMRRALNDPKVDPEIRLSVAQEISKRISQGSPDIARIWDEVSSEAIQNGESITDNEKILDSLSKPYEESQERQKGSSGNTITI